MSFQNRFRLSLRAKLYLSFACVVLTLTVGVAVSRYLTRQLSENLNTITGSVVPAIRGLGEIDSAVLAMAEAANTLWYASLAVTEPRSKVLERERGEYFGARDQLRDSRARYFKVVSAGTKEYPYTDEIRELLDSFESMADRFVSGVGDGARSGDQPELEGRLEELVPRISLVLKLAAELEAAHLRERKESAETSIGEVVRFSAIIFLSAIGLVGVISIGLYGSLFQSILELRSAAEAVGTGKFDTRVKNLNEDELGSVGESFNKMAAALETSTISRGFLQSILSSIVDAVIVVDEDDRVINVNEGFSKLSGYNAAEASGLRLDVFLPDFELSPGRTTRSTSFAVKNGSNVPVSISAAPLVETSGKRSGTVIVARDVRAQEAAAAELRRYREQLNHAQQLAALGSMSALLAHKLNQPLTVIQLLLQQSLRSIDKPEVLGAKIGESLAEVKIVSETLKEVLRFTRPTAVSADEPVSVYQIAQKLSTAFSESASEASMEIDYSGLRELPDLRGSVEEFEEMFFILFENAVHAATRSRPCRLTVSGRAEKDKVFLTFADTCSGIPPEALGRVFELFFTTKPRHLGTGLGLGILKQLINGRGGEISVRSRVGEGTTFIIELPTKRTDFYEEEGRAPE